MLRSFIVKTFSIVFKASTRRSCLSVVALNSLILIPPSQANSIKYRLQDLGHANGNNSRYVAVAGLNNNRIACGVLGLVGNSQCFVLSNGRFEIFDPTEGLPYPSFLLGLNINDQNQILYFVEEVEFRMGKFHVTDHTFLRDPDGLTKDVNPEGDFAGTGFNNNGDIVGRSNDSKDIFVYKDGALEGRTIPVPNLDMVQALSINDQGQITGMFSQWNSSYPSGYSVNGFLLNPDGQLIDFLQMTGEECRAKDINNNGDVLIEGFPTGAQYLYSDGKLIKIHENTADDYVRVEKINNRKEVIGSWNENPCVFRDGQLINLLPCIENLGEWQNIHVCAINDNGEISGVGEMQVGESPEGHVILLTPIEE